jgi:hypothetical protein
VGVSCGAAHVAPVAGGDEALNVCPGLSHPRRPGVTENMEGDPLRRVPPAYTNGEKEQTKS